MRRLAAIAILLVSCKGTINDESIPCVKGEWNSNASIQDDASLLNYSGYTHIGGNVQITNSTFTDIDPLECLVYVGRQLHVGSNPDLTDLTGLRNVTEIGGTLNIEANASLTNLSGLEGITAIGTGSHEEPKYLQIYNNDSLENVDGLSSLTSITEGLYIYENASLTNLDGLSNLQTIGGDMLLITYNPRLPQCEAEALADRLVANGYAGPVLIGDNDTTATCD